MSWLLPYKNCHPFLRGASSRNLKRRRIRLRPRKIKQTEKNILNLANLEQKTLYWVKKILDSHVVSFAITCHFSSTFAKHFRAMAEGKKIARWRDSWDVITRARARRVKRSGAVARISKPKMWQMASSGLSLSIVLWVQWVIPMLACVLLRFFLIFVLSWCIHTVLSPSKSCYFVGHLDKKVPVISQRTVSHERFLIVTLAGRCMHDGEYKCNFTQWFRSVLYLMAFWIHTSGLII